MDTRPIDPVDFASEIAETIYFNDPDVRDYGVTGRMGIPFSWNELPEERKAELIKQADQMVDRLICGHFTWFWRWWYGLARG